MRKAWVIGCFCIVNICVAQQLLMGVKAGGHVSSSFIEHTIFPLNINTTVVPGVNGGVFLRYLPKKGDSFLNSGIQLGANYVQKGWRQTFLTNTPTYTARLNYLEIPLEGIAYFRGRNKFFVSAGLHFEFLLSDELDASPDLDEIVDDFYTYDATRDRNVGYGARASGGIFRDMAFGTIQIEGFFSYSFSNFIDPGDLTTETPDLSNHWVVGGTLAYMFQIGKKKD